MSMLMSMPNVLPNVLPNIVTPAMHIPDGFIDVPTAAGAAAITAVVAAIALRRSRQTLDDATAPLAGLAAVFIFAVQMLNFPVAAGTSGHLMGGALAAILVGPAAAVLALIVVLSVQAVVFHDGGLVALGLNVLNIGIIAVLVAWVVFRMAMRVLPKTRGGALAATGLAAFISVPVSALAFVVEYAIGGTTTLPIGSVAVAMLGVHTLIGIGEAVITVLTVGAVLSVRPDLVYATRGLLRGTDLVTDSTPPAAPAARMEGTAP
jgi:cobalt/nickel transport system permease protein